MSRQACAACPFRVGSPVGYDADALEALDSIDPPGCHCIVGPEAIFAHTITPENACIGYEQWLDGAPGFTKPSLL